MHSDLFRWENTLGEWVDIGSYNTLCHRGYHHGIYRSGLDSYGCRYLLKQHKSCYCASMHWFFLVTLPQLATCCLFGGVSVCLHATTHANCVLAGLQRPEMSLFTRGCVGDCDACSESVLYQGPADCITVILGKFWQTLAHYLVKHSFSRSRHEPSHHGNCWKLSHVCSLHKRTCLLILLNHSQVWCLLGALIICTVIC